MMPGSNGNGDGTGADGGRPAAASGDGGAPELVQFVIAYAQQEVVNPVVQQVKDLGTGIAGAVLISIGTVLLGFGFVRAIQVEFGGLGQKTSSEVFGTVGHLSGNWSWVAYMGGFLFCLLVAVFCVTRITGGARR
jgi:hypothetical protein